MAWSWRTIFLLIRGIDQTGRAFEGPKRALSELEKRQKALARSSYRLLFAGAAFLAFGIMTARALGGLFGLTTKGKLLTDDLARAWTRFATTVAEQITKIMGPAIKDLTKWLDNLSKNKAFAAIIGMTGVGIAGAGIIGGLGLLGLGISKGLTFLLGGAIGGGAGAAAGGMGQTTMAQFLGGTAGTVAIKTGLVAKLGSLFAGIQGAVVSLGAGGVLGVAIPVVISVLIAKTLWDWSKMTHEEQVEWAIEAGERAAAQRQRLGITDEQYYGDQARAEAYRQMGMTGEININIYDNIFPHDMDEVEVANQLGYNIYDELSNLDGAPNHP